MEWRGVNRKRRTRLRATRGKHAKSSGEHSPGWLEFGRFAERRDERDGVDARIRVFRSSIDFLNRQFKRANLRRILRERDLVQISGKEFVGNGSEKWRFSVDTNSQFCDPAVGEIMALGFAKPIADGEVA